MLHFIKKYSKESYASGSQYLSDLEKLNLISKNNIEYIVTKNIKNKQKTY